MIEIIDPNDPRAPLSIPWAEPTHDEIMEVLHALRNLTDKRREALGGEPGDPPIVFVVDECAELAWRSSFTEDVMAEILRLGRRTLRD